MTKKTDIFPDNPNVLGVIFTDVDVPAFDHLAARMRQMTDVCGTVYEPDKIDKLISLDGKKVELELKDNYIKVEETDKPSKPMKTETIDFPKLKPCNKILTSKECTSDVIGAKAVNLRRLEELSEDGKIDAIIPKFIALPSGYLEPFMEDVNLNDEESFEKYNLLFTEFEDNGRINEVFDALKSNGIKSKEIMVRSSFNGEDLPNFSAAGMYRSTPSSLDPEEIIAKLSEVANSQYGLSAKHIKSRYNIPDESFMPGIILQEKIKPDYRFTLYTDDNKGNLKIDLYSSKRTALSVVPHTYTYNKESGELTYDSIQTEPFEVYFNEDEEIAGYAPEIDNLEGNEKLFDQLKKVAENALVVEKEFRAPQDIEGGIKGDDIYFWQSRKIVNKKN